MTPGDRTASRERILQAALTLLETGGAEAVSTRAISAAADVQPPTIYRQFGDMQGLLKAVARAGFSAYLNEKGVRQRRIDPIEELREGWNLHVEFGLTRPHLYRLMYAARKTDSDTSLAFEMLENLLQRVAEVGRLSVSVTRAAQLVHASAVGVTLTLLSAKVHDIKLSDLMLNAVLNAILTQGAQTTSEQLEPRAAAHAVALAALLPKLETPFSEAERGLFGEWLQRLM